MDVRNKLRYKFAIGLIFSAFIITFAGASKTILASGLIGAGIWAFFEEYSYQKSTDKTGGKDGKH